MFIVDAQVHIWGPDTPGRPWPVYPTASKPNPPHLPVPLTAESLLPRMDELGIRRAILIPPSWEGERNDLVLDAARRYPDRFAAVGRLNIPSRPARASNWQRGAGNRA